MYVYVYSRCYFSCACCTLLSARWYFACITSAHVHTNAHSATPVKYIISASPRSFGAAPPAQGTARAELRIAVFSSMACHCHCQWTQIFVRLNCAKMAEKIIERSKDANFRILDKSIRNKWRCGWKLRISTINSCQITNCQTWSWHLHLVQWQKHKLRRIR